MLHLIKKRQQMKTSPNTVPSSRLDIKRKSRRRPKNDRNSIGIHPETVPVSFISFSEDKINNKILFYALVKHQHQ